MANVVISKIVVNCATGQREVVPLTEAELLEREAMTLEAEAQRAAEEAAAQALADLKASAKAKLIAGQPLTAEEADTLVL